MLAIFTVWIPLAALAGALAARLPVNDDAGAQSRVAAGIAVVGVYAVALGLGAGLGGILVGRWGPAGVGAREGALAGLGAAVVAVGVTWLAFGPSAGALLVAAVAAPMAALGGRVGRAPASGRAESRLTILEKRGRAAKPQSRREQVFSLMNPFFERPGDPAALVSPIDDRAG